MKHRSLARRAAFLAIALTGAIAACSAGNGDVGPPEIQDAAPVEAGIGPDPEAAAKDSPADTTPGDGGDGGGPVIVINEVYVDVATGGGAQTEFVELRAEQGTLLGDLRIRLVAANGTTREFPVSGPAAVVPGTGYWVIGGSNLPGGQIANELITNPAGWGLDTRFAVQLLRGAQLVDVVGWSDDQDAAAVTPPATPPTAVGEGPRVLLPTAAGKSIGRRPTGADTNNNAADFCRMNATPRAANSAVCDP